MEEHKGKCRVLNKQCRVLKVLQNINYFLWNYPRLLVAHDTACQSGQLQPRVSRHVWPWRLRPGWGPQVKWQGKCHPFGLPFHTRLFLQENKVSVSQSHRSWRGKETTDTTAAAALLGSGDQRRPDGFWDLPPAKQGLP